MPAKLPTHKPTTGKAPTTERQSRRFLHTGSAQWRSIRRAQLERFPMCEDCHDQPANEVDHNTDDTSRNLIGVELSSLCKPCHSKRTAARLYGRPKPRIVGCDVNGWPLDPDHPANGEKSLEGEPSRHVTPASNAWPQIGGSDNG